MGKVEKIVVLSVLFLIVVILAVSLNGNRDDLNDRRGEIAGATEQTETEAGRTTAPIYVPVVEEDRVAGEGSLVGGPAGPEYGTAGAPPLGGQDLETRLADASGPRGSIAPDPAAGEWERVGDRIDLATPERTSGLLDSSVQVNQPSANATGGSRGGDGFLGAGSTTLPRIAIEGDWDLVSTTGLERTPNPDFLLLTCRAGDDYASVAKSLYGDTVFESLLRRNNETIDTLSGGQRILVPVRDDMKLHTVADGENLWNIAKQYYGSGTKWERIIDANRGTLKSPADLKPGMKLLIPR